LQRERQGQRVVDVVADIGVEDDRLRSRRLRLRRTNRTEAEEEN